ncbi:MAG: efflux RND transporter periplasmic adaptor subunit [Oceanospirillaceae bacterium]
MKKRLLCSLLSLLPFALFATEKSEPKAKTIPVMVVQISSDSVSVSQDFPGRVSAFRTAEVRARVTGIVEKRVFDEGSKVVAGQVLFQIENRSLLATVRAGKADVANANAAYNLSRLTLARYKKLLDIGAVSRQEYDANRAQNQQSKAQVQQAKANLEIAQINLDYSTVTAPIDGRIDRALVTEGALVTKDSTQLATIEQIGKVYIDFSKPSASGPQTSNENSDTAIEILFSDGTIYPHKAQLEFSSMSVDQATGAISLRAVVDNPNFSLLPGMFVRVKVPTAGSNQLKIPQKAVIIGAKGAVVFLVKDKKLASTPIKLGAMNGASWFVKSGLKAGDRVVVSDTTILSTIPGASFIGMTAAEMQAAGMAKKSQ